MTTFNLQLEDKIYKIDLYPEVRVAITRHMMQLYADFYAVDPRNIQTSFEQWLTMVESQNHPENHNQIVEAEELSEDEVDILRDQMRRKDKMIDALLEAIAKMK
jgi:hypothetical protein